MRQGKTLTEEATVQQGSGGEPKQRSRNRSRQGLRPWREWLTIRNRSQQGLRLGPTRAAAVTGEGCSSDRWVLPRREKGQMMPRDQYRSRLFLTIRGRCAATADGESTSATARRRI
ncbi:hypothetical protein BHE74_00012578 [Ensete ventricosum]|nr:hypothetical protein BHE74_00012578 [Ensete ventricosum]